MWTTFVADILRYHIRAITCVTYRLFVPPALSFVPATPSSQAGPQPIRAEAVNAWFALHLQDICSHAIET